MSDTEIRMMRYTIEQLSAELQSLRKYVRDIEQKLDRTHKTSGASSVENVPGPIKLYVCADGSVYGNLDVAKSHAKSIFNPSPAGATTTDRVYLERELNRTRKALDVAVDALKSAQQYICSDKKSYQIIQTALEQITALEQKDNK